MELTGIGVENLEAFRPLMGGRGLESSRVALGAICDGRPAGTAMFTDIDDALMLDHIYVSPDHRRQGTGRAMVKGFLEE